MSDSKIYIPDFLREDDDTEYIAKNLVPAVDQLNTLVNKLMGDGEVIEMTTHRTFDAGKDIYLPVDTYVVQRKLNTIEFDPNDYPAVKGDKTRKIMFTAEVRSKYGYTCTFKLVNTVTRRMIASSHIVCSSKDPIVRNCYLPVSELPSHIQPFKAKYHVAASYQRKQDYPILRDFRLSAVYV
jgi:hypothetical protein